MLMAAYKVTKNATLQLNIYNLTDKYLLRVGLLPNWAVPGVRPLGGADLPRAFEPDLHADQDGGSSSSARILRC